MFKVVSLSYQYVSVLNLFYVENLPVVVKKARALSLEPPAQTFSLFL